MDLAFVEQDWQELFRLAAEAKALKREEELQRFYDELDREKTQKHKHEEKEKEAKELEEAVATSAQIAAFESRLDEYDSKTVHALMENGEALDRIHDQLRVMQEEAYVLPDGRHVFKTKDGQRVFDEHGAELGREVINPQIISDNRTKWEPFKAAKDAETRLQTERQGLLEFQAKLDHARDRLGKGNISKQELDALDADLKANAPMAVRQQSGHAGLENDRDAAHRSEDLALIQAASTDNPSRHPRPTPAPR